MSSDSNTTVQTLKDLVQEFRDERDWKKFHDPKNLAEAITIEAAELMELFLWKTVADVEISMKSDTNFKKAIQEELADIICFSLNLANATDIDVARAVKEKIAANDHKPASPISGRPWVKARTSICLPIRGPSLRKPT